jgi:lysozyme
VLSDNGRKLLQSLEGLRLDAYPDGKNPDGSPKYSIGYGHSGAKKGDRITEQQADDLFAADVQARDAGVAQGVAGHPTTPGQFDALVSFAYNVGVPAFLSSTLLRLHNVGDYAGAAAEFPKWIHSAGQVDPRLVDRREVEHDVYVAASPGRTPWPLPSEAPDTESPPAMAGPGALIFFCPCCGGRCAATIVDKRAS